jgi:hypothetical protein
MPLTHIRRIGLPLVAAIGVSAAAAAPAVAMAGTPSGVGTYKTWAEAQKAAGFKLYKPTTTYKLPNVGHVIVSVCEVSGATNKRVVTVSFGNFNTHSLELTQNNYGRACGDGNQGTYLGSSRVHGVPAKLYGFCNMLGAPSCSSAKIEMWLIWAHKGVYYVASSFNESRKNLENFASTLKAA